MKDRRIELEKQLKRERVKVEWFVQEEKNPYTQKEIDTYYLYNNQEWKRKVKLIDSHLFPRRLGIGEICVTMNHFKIFKLISEDRGPYGLILENDVILTHKFNLKLKNLLKRLRNLEWDICFIDWCAATPPKSNHPEIIFSRKDNSSWGNAGYIVKKEVAAKITNNFERFSLPADEELKYLVKKYGFKVIWANPPLTVQGSITGKFKSSLTEDRENNGIKRYISWRKNIYLLLDRKYLNIILRLLIKLETKIKGVLIG
jgi:GR25 family glycosyltransferase involved in LPS biosynthesis